MMDRSPLCSKLCGKLSTGTREEDFKGFYHIWTWQPTCHVTSIISVDFYFHVPESLHTKLYSKLLSRFREKSV